MSDRENRPIVPSGSPGDPGEPEPGVRPQRGPGEIAYIAPFAAFLILTTLEGPLVKMMGNGEAATYPVVYGIKIALVALVIWICRSTWRDLKAPSAAAALAAALTGLAATALWIGLDGRYPALPLTGPRQAFDPSELAPGTRGLFLAARFLGLVVLVPLLEELFWRSFLVRWLDRSDFRSLPVGHVSLRSGLLTSVFFAIAHPEWLPGLLTGLLWALLLYKTRSVTACLISHVMANLALGLYVVSRNAWHFW